MEQATLFDLGPDWPRHWVGMPEFSHEDMRPYRTILVHFESNTDVENFAALVGQPITRQTKSMWHPELAHTRMMDKRYAYVESE